MRVISPQELALLFLTFLWSVTFITIQNILYYVDARSLVAMRFLLAAIFSLTLSWKSLKHINPYDAFTACIVGCTIFLGYLCQTAGLNDVTSSQSAFITTFYVPLVPFIQWGLTKKPPRLNMWVAIFCSFVGLIILTGYQNIFTLHVQKGVIMTALCAVFVACEISLIGYFAPSIHNTANTATMQMAVAGILAGLSATIFSTPKIHLSWHWKALIILLALIGDLYLLRKTDIWPLFWSSESLFRIRFEGYFLRLMTCKRYSF